MLGGAAGYASNMSLGGIEAIVRASLEGVATILAGAAIITATGDVGVDGAVAMTAGAATMTNTGSQLGTLFPLTCWYRSDAGNMTLNGSKVSAWADLSGNGFNLSQVTDANRPTYVANGGANNRPYTSWTSATAQQLKNIALTQLTQPFEVIVVMNPSVLNTTGSGYLVDFNGGNNNLTYIPGADTKIAQYDGTPQKHQSISINTDYVVESLFNGAPSNMWLNNVAGTPANPGTVNPAGTGVSLGYYAGNSLSFGGRIYELMIIPRAITTAERAALADYFTSIYGVA